MKKNPFLRWKRLIKCRSFFHVMSLTLVLTLGKFVGIWRKSRARHYFIEFARGEIGEVRGGDETENGIEFPVQFIAV